MSKHIYAEINNLQPVIDWLKTKPEGKCSVVIGGCSDAGPYFVDSFGSDLALARWLFDKVSVGDFDFRSSKAGLELPVGLVIAD
jgi:hypothetical protein